MNIIELPIDEIQPYEQNPRINDQAVDAVAASIKEFGWNVPLVCDEHKILIAGHTRLIAAQQLGLEKVPVYIAAGLSPEQARAYRIADNKSAELSEWDLELLPIELEAIQDDGFDLGLIGFDQRELTSLLHTGTQDGLCDPDEIPEPPEEPITHRGDLWLLGEHRLLCGDSASTEDVDRLLDGSEIHLVNTDPPYGVKVEPRSNNAIAAGLSSFTGCESGPADATLRAKDRPIANDAVSDAEFDRLLEAWFGNITRVLLPGRGFYSWGGYANLENYPPVLKQQELYFSQVIVWDKQHPVLNRKDFMSSFGLCYYGWKQGAAHQYFGPHNATDLWQVKKVSSHESLHLTHKPVELAVRAIEYSSQPGENVLDLFGGSGSTLIGCEQTGRKAFLMELDPLYCDVIVARFEQFTGSKATRIPAEDSTDD